jgi:Uma2 family endonuclease
MAELLRKMTVPDYPDISHIITEDETPVDNMFSEQQQRLLAESLKSNWKPGRSFIAAANVGLFYDIYEPPIVPDVFVSLDVMRPGDLWEKKNRSYFVWEYGKSPEVAVEIVSNKKGGEAGDKFQKYARAGVRYYIVFDPQRQVQNDVLRIFELFGGQYIPKIDRYLSRAGLGVTLWEGIFEDVYTCWLRWQDDKGNLILTGRESTELEKKRAETAEKRAETAEKRSFEIVLNLLRKGLPDDMITECTGFSADQLAALRNRKIF